MAKVYAVQVNDTVTTEVHPNGDVVVTRTEGKKVNLIALSRADWLKLVRETGKLADTQKADKAARVSK